MPAQKKRVWGDTAGRVSVSWLYAGLTDVDLPGAGFDAAVYGELVNILSLQGAEGRSGVGLVPVQNWVPIYKKPWLTILALVYGGPRISFDSPSTTGTGAGPVSLNLDPNRPSVCHVEWRTDAAGNPDPVALAAGIAHEGIHLLEFPDGGLTGHEKGPSATGGPNIMDETAPAGGRMSKDRLAQVRDSVGRHLAGQRFGWYYPLVGGAANPTRGWNTVGIVSFV